jgi:2',3'-cyclic-nucleotide 2'-phosphodiesterase (5'-nucleotidase family)
MGVDTLSSLIEKSNFPWILSNVIDAESKKPMVKAKRTHVVEIEDVKVNLILQ